jgi:hypothetical protein
MLRGKTDLNDARRFAGRGRSAIHDAVSPLTTFGIKNSYQNEGDASEAD